MTEPSSVGSAGEAVATAFKAAEQRDWQTLIDVLDPEEMERFKQQQRLLLSMNMEFAPRSDGGLLRRVFGVNDLSSYDALPAAIVVRRWLVVSDGPPERPPFPQRVRSVIGQVLEAPDLAHVVLREKWVDSGKELVRLTSARVVGGRWRVGLGGGLVTDETGGSAIGYGEDSADPTLGESEFRIPQA